MADLNQASPVIPSDLEVALTGVDLQPVTSPTDTQKGQSSQPTKVDSTDTKDADRRDENDERIDHKETAIGVPNNDEVDDDLRTWNPGRLTAFLAWFGSNASFVYASQALSAWGDRMWTFAVALYLIEIEDNSLRLTAVFGVSLTISVLLFGTLVGHWVDRTPRLRAARQTLFIQNFSVILNAICLLVLLHYKSDIVPIGDGALYLACQSVIIILGVFANLASMAEKICIQKDWVVILAGGDKERLAVMNASVRRIDLTVNILAPVLVGQIMTYGSMTISGIFIAAWNLVSLVLEYILLLHVYKRVPRLAIKMGKEVTDASEPAGETEETGTSDETEESPKQAAFSSVQEDAGKAQDRALLLYSDEEITEENAVTNPDQSTPTSECDKQPSSTSATSRIQRGPLRRLASWFLSTYDGWQIYKSYRVYLAGMALASLYMTVMGFNSITNGYGYALGLSESLLGVLGGIGSLSGIIGTFIFTHMRHRIGITRTGLYALGEEILCLTLCIVSIWAPGSLFDPYNYFWGQSNTPTTNGTIELNSTTMPLHFIPTTTFLQPSPSGDVLITDMMTTSSSRQKRFADVFRRSVLEDNITDVTTALPKFTPDVSSQPARTITNYASAVLFFVGVITSRIGLWMFDLVTTQLIQEHVSENQRGVFNGVQRSLECTMDTLHFILVIILPDPETFGILIILSFVFICMGLLLYSIYVFRERGHLFHPEKLTACIQNGCPNGVGVRLLVETDVEA